MTWIGVLAGVGFVASGVVSHRRGGPRWQVVTYVVSGLALVFLALTS